MQPKTQPAALQRLRRTAIFVASIALVAIFYSQGHIETRQVAAQSSLPGYPNLIFQEEFDAPLDIGITGTHKWRPGWTTWAIRYLEGNWDKAYKVLDSEIGWDNTSGGWLPSNRSYGDALRSVPAFVQAHGTGPYNHEVSNGTLKMRAFRVPIAVKNTDFGGFPFTAGMLSTEDSFAWKYGYMETRLRFPRTSQGMHFGFWTLSQDNKRWEPDYGPEIDVLEVLHSLNAERPSWWHQNIIGVPTGPEDHGYPWSGYTQVDTYDQWHTVGVERTPTQIRFFIDGVLTRAEDVTGKTQYTDENHYILMTWEIDGRWPGEVQSTDPNWNVEVEVDYVRVYSGSPPAPTPTPIPTPTSSNARSGKWSVQGNLGPTWQNIMQSRAVTPNTSYIAQVWVKGTPGTRFSLEVQNNTWSGSLAKITCTASDVWTRCRTRAFNSRSNSSVYFILYDEYGIGTVYVDDAFLGVAGGANLLLNANFERGASDWIPSGTPWQIVKIPPPSNVHSGQWSAQGDLGPTWQTLMQPQAVIANTTYVASVWVKGATGARFSLEVQNSTWTGALARVTCTAGNTWRRCQTPSFNTGSNSSVYFILYDAYGGGRVYVDDAFLGVAGGANLLRNANFERGATDWIPSGAPWKIVQSTTLLAAADVLTVPDDETSVEGNTSADEEGPPIDDTAPAEMSHIFFLPLLMVDSTLAQP